jgi:diphthamide biosynthesis protein 2
MQRYAQIEKVKSEQTQVVGILIGSVVVENYLALINRIKVTAAKAGKKYYEVLIGKLNEPKLKNFQFVRLLYLDHFYI